MAQPSTLDPSSLQAFPHPAAGHDGVLSDPTGELLIKPCTQAEIDFYQESLMQHPKFYELMPTFMGTLSLGAPTAPSSSDDSQSTPKPTLSSAIVLENLEHGFLHPNVLDLKLGAKLYAPGTAPDKAARLDEVSANTTSGSLNFRIAGMKVWNGQDTDMYDKSYGRKFSAENVRDGFAAFFAGLAAGVAREEAYQLLETVLAEVTKARHSLERSESRMYSASLLIVYEGDGEALGGLLRGRDKEVRGDEVVPSQKEIEESLEEEEEVVEGGGGSGEGKTVTHRVRLIDFAHAEWTPGEGRDENVIAGLKNVEEQIEEVIARFE